MRRAFMALAVLPLLLWGAALWYLSGLEGWGAWGAAGPLLAPIVGLSAGMGLLGAGLWRRARRRNEPSATVALATGVASVVAVYHAVRALV